MLSSEFATAAPSVLRVSCFAIAFLWLSLALGRRLLAWLGGSTGASTAELVVVAAAVGTGALQAIPLLLGSVGAFESTPLLIAVGATALLLARDLWLVAKRGLETLRALPRPASWQVLWWLALVPGLVAIALLVLSPTVDNDGLIYHLTVPKRWLHAGALEYLVTYPYSNTPMGAQSLFGIALVFAGDCAAKWLHFEAAALGGAAAFLVGLRFHGRLAGTAAATLQFLLYSLRHATLGSAYIEGLLTFEMCAALLAWVIAFQHGDRKWFRVSMLLAGISVSFKITSAGFAIPLCGLTAYVVFEQNLGRHSEWKAAARATARSIAGLTGLVALPVVPWLVRAALLTGNPFFPMLAGRIATRDLSGESAARFSQAMRFRNWGATVDWSLAKRQLFVGAFGLGLVLLTLGLCVVVLRSRVARAGAGACLVAALLQLWTVGLNTRLWLPMLLTMTVPLIIWLGGGLKARWTPAVLIGMAAFGSSIHLGKARNESKSSLRELARAAISASAQRQVLLGAKPQFPLCEWANRELPLDARVLLSNYPLGFYVDRSTLVLDFVQDALRFRTMAEFIADTTRLGITHVIVRAPFGPPDSLIDHHREFEIVESFVRDHGQLLVRFDDAELYAITRQRH